MIKRSITFIFFLSWVFSYSQQLENDIYNAVDDFITNQNDTSLKTLNDKEALFLKSVSNKNEHLALVILQCNKAYFLRQQNELKKSISTYEKAWKRFSDENLSNYDIIEYCLKPLGNLYTISRNYTDAEHIINQYIYLAEKNHNIIHKNAGIINLSVVYQNIGSYQNAITIIKQALKTPNLNEKQKVLLQNNLAMNLIAQKKYNEAQEIIAQNSTSKNDSQLNFYKNASQIEILKGNFKKAILYFEKAKSIFFNQKIISARAVAKLYTEEAQLKFYANDSNNAYKSLFKALITLLPNFDGNGLPSKDILYAENTFIDIFDLYGDFQNNSTIALESYDLSFYVSSLLVDNISSQEAKILNQLNERSRSEKCIEILVDSYSKSKQEQFLFAAFEYSEKSKVSVLKEMSEKKNLLSLHPEDSLLVKEQLLLQEQEQLTNALIQETLKKSSSIKINNLSKKLSEISFALTPLKDQILERYGKLNKEDISFKELQNKLLTDHAVLVEYFYGKHAIYQFVITKDDLSFTKIILDDSSKNNIVEFIRFFDNASVINNDIKNYTQEALKIFEFLNFSVTKSYKNVIIIPDGLINFVPFEALLNKTTESTNFSKMPFIVKQQNVVYNSSVLFYLKKRQRLKIEKVLGYFPVFENSNQELGYSIEEADVIKKEMPSFLLLNEKATKAHFLKNASNYKILHLSTHASSGDFSIPASIQFYDENLFINELYGLDLDFKLVVLSACETGIGKLHKGEGPMSIARGFQYAGAQSILFSLWQINDKSTSEIIRLFYQLFSDKQSVFIANHDAKIAYLEDMNISNVKKSPYYWGAFVYYGEISPSVSTDNKIVYIISFALLLILFLVAIKYFKKIIK